MSLFEQEMRVTKRNGLLEEVTFDKIMKRMRKCGEERDLRMNYSALVMKIIDQLYDKIETSKIDELTAEQCASQATQHSDFGILASQLIISNHHKNTTPSFFHVMQQLYNFKDIHNLHSPLVSETFMDDVNTIGADTIESMIHYERDYLFDYFGYKTLERA